MTNGNKTSWSTPTRNAYQSLLPMMAPTIVVSPKRWGDEKVFTWKEERADKEDQVPWLRNGWDCLQHELRRLHLLENTHDIEFRKNTKYPKTDYTDTLTGTDFKNGINVYVRFLYASYSSKKDKRYFSSYLEITAISSHVRNTIVHDKPRRHSCNDKRHWVQKQDLPPNTVVEPTRIGRVPENGVHARCHQFVSVILFFPNHMSEIGFHFDFRRCAKHVADPSNDETHPEEVGRIFPPTGEKKTRLYHFNNLYSIQNSLIPITVHNT